MCVMTASAGCGNYSNEDLEFTAALPEHADLTAEVPVRSAVVGFETAELYRMSRNIALIFNGTSAALLALVDTIRALHPPSASQTCGSGDRSRPKTNRAGWPRW